MSKKKVVIYICLVFAFTSFLFYVFYVNSLKLNSKSIGAAVTPIASDDIVLITAAKTMIEDNMDEYNNKEVEITVKDLIRGNYLKGTEINPISEQEYSENIRVLAKVNNNKITDIYVKNEPFKNVYECTDTCYIEEDYIIYNNENYRIIKIDYNGFIYITNNQTIEVYKNEIDSKLSFIYNNSDKNIVKNIVSVNINDFKESNVISKGSDLFIDTSMGIKLYNSKTDEIEDVDNVKTNLLPIIILRNDITYEMGDGSLLNPYVITK